MTAHPHQVCWRRMDHPGHELATLVPHSEGWLLSGMAVMVHAGIPCAFTYVVDLDGTWRTRMGVVEGSVGDRSVKIRLEVDDAGRWWRDGVECPALAGCVDVDYGFSPSTNLLPIRRLAPAVGAEVPVRAAWLRFPELTMQPLEQTYRRVDERVYVYESAGGAFRAELHVDAEGMVVRYGDIWTVETGRAPA